MIIALALYLGVTPATPQFKDDRGNVIPESIAVLEEIELGNMKQWISVRGRDRTNPVLLWLHGGPGSAQMPLAHHLDRSLEREFVVVHWDQRGAGKSNHCGFDIKTMSVEQFKDDARELIAYLQDLLGQERVYLLGHSWGTLLGIELAAEDPDLFHAYIGVSQVVDNQRAERIAYNWLLEEIEQNDNREDLGKLQAIGEPPYNHNEYRNLARLVAAYGGNFDVELWQLALVAAKAPEYTFIDYFRMLDGMTRGGGPLHDESKMMQFNFIEQVPAAEIPVYFLIGAKDYNTPLELVEKYYKVIDAPQKGLVVFEKSAHTPFYRENDQFNRSIIEIKAGTYLQ